MLPSGARVGKYQIGEQLGSGSYGVIYKARDVALGRDLALKVLRPQHVARPDLVSRFLREARAAASVNHPGIVTVFECGVDETTPGARGTVYIAMELLRGETIAERMKHGRVPMAMALRMVRQAASALGAAHSAGIVHRDLKPDNLFLVPDSMVFGGERLKILDFGIAKLVDPDRPDVTKTGATTLLGTPMYMSPEQCRSSTNVDARSDIYTLGCILFELICNRTPFRGDAGELIAMHQLGDIPDPRLYAPDIAPPVRALLRAMMAKSPEDRPQNMEQVDAQLETCIAEEDDGPTNIGRGTPLRVAAAPPVAPMTAAAPSVIGGVVAGEIDRKGRRAATAPLVERDDEHELVDHEITVRSAADLETPDTERMAPRPRGKSGPTAARPDADTVTVPRMENPNVVPVAAAVAPSGPHTTKPGVGSPGPGAFAAAKISTTPAAGMPPPRASAANLARDGVTRDPIDERDTVPRYGSKKPSKSKSSAARWLGPLVILTGVTLGIAVALGVRECSRRVSPEVPQPQTEIAKPPVIGSLPPPPPVSAHVVAPTPAQILAPTPALDAGAPVTAAAPIETTVAADAAETATIANATPPPKPAIAPTQARPPQPVANARCSADDFVDVAKTSFEKSRYDDVIEAVSSGLKCAPKHQMLLKFGVMAACKTGSATLANRWFESIASAAVQADLKVSCNQRNIRLVAIDLSSRP